MNKKIIQQVEREAWLDGHEGHGYKNDPFLQKEEESIHDFLSWLKGLAIADRPRPVPTIGSVDGWKVEVGIDGTLEISSSAFGFEGEGTHNDPFEAEGGEKREVFLPRLQTLSDELGRVVFGRFSGKISPVYPAREMAHELLEVLATLNEG